MRAAWACLTYHAIPAASQTPTSHLAVPFDVFGGQLAWLAVHGIRGDTMEVAAAAATPSVVGITFDDGDETQYHHALPLLLEHGAHATFFIVTDWVGRPGYVTWPQLREMRAAGMSIQSHSTSHQFFSLLSPDQIRHELRESKQRLDEQLDQETTSLALPGGDEPRDFQIFREAGYRLVGTSRVGVNRPVTGGAVHPVRRLTVRWGHPEDMFARLVTQDRRTVGAAALRWRAVSAVRGVLGRRRYHEWRAVLARKVPGLLRRFGA